MIAPAPEAIEVEKQNRSFFNFCLFKGDVMDGMNCIVCNESSMLYETKNGVTASFCFRHFQPVAEKEMVRICTR